MNRSNRELWQAVIAILLITLIYLLVINFTRGIPPAGDLFGHGIGILGFVLMLMTETLYSLRKRSRTSRWGRMSKWLQFHIFTGLVGPYMVLLHTSWKFNGLAGLLVLFTLVIVVSGFIGRYIYTAVPRTIDGAEVQADDLENQIQNTETELRSFMETQPEAARLLANLEAATPEPAGSGMGLIFRRVFTDWRYRWRWAQVRRGLPAAVRPQADQLEQLQVQKRTLLRQLASLAIARQMLGVWQMVHMPIGMAMFTIAFLHIGATLYYTSLLR
jgi:hypothetical protein